MPRARARPCTHPGCKALTRGDGFKGLCPDHAPVKQEADKVKDRERGSSTKRGYGYRWQKARKTFLMRNPLCAACSTEVTPVLATEVDHKVPHRIGEALDSEDIDRIRAAQDLFWDSSNWQGLCKTCHSIKTVREDGGFGNPALRRMG